MTEPYRVLIVEDNPVSQKIIQKIIHKVGYESVCVNNGRKALDLFEKQFFPIVLTDWIMPEMDGIELCRAIRSKPTPGYVYILLLTAKGTDTDLIKGLETGADNYLIKPVNPLELVARLNTAKRVIELEKSLKNSNEQLQVEIDRLHQTQDELQAAREQLEDKVGERTSQLVQINERLRKEIDERSSIEHRLKEALARAETATKAKSEFLANMSHEIRTPLYGIVGMVEIAMESGLTHEQKATLNIIESEANALLSIVNEVLDFSKLEAGKLFLEEIPFDLEYLIRDFKNSFEIMAQRKGLKFSYSTPSNLDCQLIGDPGRLRQILTNLAGNSLKFTHQGEISIHAKILKEMTDTVMVRFSVQDTGIGIAKERQKEIFESFTQADGSTTRQYGGTGLGTSISKQLVGLMGGEIGVESTEGRGSCFWFDIGFKKLDVSGSAEKNELEDPGRFHILLVDDNKTGNSLTYDLLISSGCRVLTAFDRLDQLAAMTDIKTEIKDCNVIVIDSYIQGSRAFEFARKIRSQTNLNNIPIVMLASHGEKGDGKKCSEIGVNAYLTRPVAMTMHSNRSINRSSRKKLRNSDLSLSAAKQRMMKSPLAK